MEILEWLLYPCYQQMLQLAPPLTLKRPPTLQEYFNRPTFSFTLTNEGDQLKASISTPTSADDFTRKIPASEELVRQAVSQGVSCIPASQVYSVLSPDALDCDYNIMPTKVGVSGSDEQYIFKDAFDIESFSRELDILLRLKNFPKLPLSDCNELRTSRICGLVEEENEDAILGLMIEYIPDTAELDHALQDASSADTAKWMKQVRNTVKMLHDEDNAWGCVHSSN